MNLFDLLLEWGADLKSAEVYTVLNTYNVELIASRIRSEPLEGLDIDGRAPWAF